MFEKNMSEAIWITWESQVRNRSLSKKFNADLFEIRTKKSGVSRYAYCLYRTLKTLRDNRPRTLFVQSPSIVLAAFAVTVGRFWCSKVVIDAHNAGIFPLEGRSTILNRTCSWILSNADCIFVSNSELAAVLGLANCEVLPDPFPYGRETCGGQEGISESSEGREIVVTFITSWALDEPILEVIEAVRRLPDNILVQITGRPPPHISRVALPVNLKLLGFVNDAEYPGVLCRSDIIVVLTTRPSCLTCGAYEAIALGKPVVVSRTTALEAYFGDGALYTSNDAETISRTIVAATGSLESLVQRSRAARDRLEQAWERRFARIASQIDRRP